MASIKDYQNYQKDKNYHKYVDSMSNWNYVFDENGLQYLVIGDKRLVEDAFEDNYDIYYSNNGMICGTNENKKWREFINADDETESVIMTYDEIVKVFGEYVAEPIYYRGDCDEFN